MRKTTAKKTVRTKAATKAEATPPAKPKPTPTPGPWKAVERQGHGTNVRGEATIAWCGANGAYDLVNNKHYVISGDEAYANACLISAAPELLKALEDLLAVTDLGDGNQAEYYAALSAIRKARDVAL